MSVGSRIKELREHKDISRNSLAKLVGVTPGAISNYENGVSSPKEAILFKLMEVLNCDANYLYQDDMEIKPSIFTTTLEEQVFLSKYRKLTPKSKGAVDTLLEYEYDQLQHELELSTINESSEGYGKKVIQFSGKANDAQPVPKDEETAELDYFEGGYSAGAGQPNNTGDTIKVAYPADWIPYGADTTFKVIGDSMEPTYYDGDVVFVKTTTELYPGDIGAFYLDGDNFIKEMGQGELISHNPEYDPIQISEFASFKIQGKVLGKM